MNDARDDRATRPVVRADVDIAAPPERVFDALTDPTVLTEWLGGDDAHAAPAGEHDAPASSDGPSPTSPEPGTRWSVPARAPDGRPGRAAGEYRLVDPPRRLDTTWTPSWEVQPSHVRFDLAPADVDGVPGTRLTVTHTGPVLRARATPVAMAAGGAAYLVLRGTLVHAPRHGRRARRAPVLA